MQNAAAARKRNVSLSVDDAETVSSRQREVNEKEISTFTSAEDGICILSL